MFKVLGGLILVGVLAIIGFYFYSSSNKIASGGHISFELPEKVFVGVPFDLIVNVNNESGNLWQDARISLSLPEGVVFVGGLPEKSFAIKNLGNLGGGSLTQSSFKLMKVFLENENSALSPAIEALLSFNPEGVGSRFEERKKIEIVNLESAVNLELLASEKVVSGEKFNLKIKYKNISPVDLNDLFLKIDYPKVFSYEKAGTEPDSQNNFWNLGDLRSQSEGELSVSGKLLNTSSSSVAFAAAIGREENSNKYVIAKSGAEITTSESPLTVNIDLNESPDFVAKPGDALNYAIGYSLSSGTTGSDKVIIKAKLTGSIFDLPTISVGDGGAILSGSNQLVWNLSGRDVEGGSATFSVKVKNDYGIKRLGDRNFVLKVEAEAVSGDYASKAELQTKVAGKITIASQGYFRDIDAGIINKGPLPPKVGNPTNYTVHWKVANYANDVKDVEARAQLQPGVLFVDSVKGDTDAKPTLDTSTNEVVWKISRISATTGITNKPIETVFQIQATPAPQNVNQYLPLLGETKIIAKDDFTGLFLEAVAVPITTALPDDLTVGASGVVVP